MLEITWLGHGTFHFRLDTGEVLLLDPWTEGNPAYPAGYKVVALQPGKPVSW
jgi:L-ascorbate metabolism protein UlaG (beta-lactamase superfamily)